MIRRSEGQTAKIEDLEQAEELFILFVGGYLKDEEDNKEDLETRDDYDALLRSFEVPHEADEVCENDEFFNWLIGRNDV